MVELTDRVENHVKKSDGAMYQVSTLQALMLGYTKGVITAEELRKHGDTGLGTFQDVNGEMILLDHKVYRADQEGCVTEVDPQIGVPFAAAASLKGAEEITLTAAASVEDVKQQLNLLVDSSFGLNSMHVVQLEGRFIRIKARSEAGRHSQQWSSARS